MSDTLHKAAEKISIARASIVAKHPFFAPFILARMCVPGDPPGAPEGFNRTMCTDGKTIWYSPDFVNSISLKHVIGVLIHEILHIILKHHLRRDDRIGEVFNVACDYVINPMVREAGCELPGKATVNGEEMDLTMHLSDKYKDMSAEQVYEILMKDVTVIKVCMSSTGVGDVVPPTGEGGKPMSADEIESAGIAIDQETVAAWQANDRQWGSIPGKIQAMLKELIEPKVDWQKHLRRAFTGERPEGYSYTRIARNPYITAGMIAPTMERKGVGEVVVAIDTSGSVSDAELKQFISEVAHIVDEIQPENVVVIQCDYEVQRTDEYLRGEGFTVPKVAGRGGTRVQPVFDWVEANMMKQPDKLIYFTDMGIGDFDPQPDYPVFWVSSTNQTAPYGETVHVKIRD